MRAGTIARFSAVAGLPKGPETSLRHKRIPIQRRERPGGQDPAFSGSPMSESRGLAARFGEVCTGGARDAHRRHVWPP
jgi:hypothetical protein